MRSVGRLDSPSSPHYDHSTRAPSEDFSHELVKADDKHAREAFDRRQAAEAIKVSAPTAGDSGSNHAAPLESAVAHPLSALQTDIATTIPQSTGPSSLVIPSSEKISFLMRGATSTAMATASTAYDKTGTASALTPFGDVNQARGPVLSLSTAVTAELNGAQSELAQVVQPTGVTEALIGSRIYGVHLFADPFLSELVESPSAVRGQDEGVSHSTGSGPSVAISVVDTNRSSAENDVETTAAQQEEIVAALTLLADGNESVSISTRTSSVLSTTAAEASTAFWPESSVRLTKQRDGSAVIWLRDYRASSDDASQLVEAMVKGANAKGMRLGRIVLNGREVWTSRNNH